MMAQVTQCRAALCCVFRCQSSCDWHNGARRARWCLGFSLLPRTPRRRRGTPASGARFRARATRHVERIRALARARAARARCRQRRRVCVLPYARAACSARRRRFDVMFYAQAFCFLPALTLICAVSGAPSLRVIFPPACGRQHAQRRSRRCPQKRAGAPEVEVLLRHHD